MDQRNKHGRIDKVHQSLMQPKLHTRTVGSQRITKNVFFAIKEIKEGAKLTFDYNWECDEDQTRTECKCGTVNCKGFIERIV